MSWLAALVRDPPRTADGLASALGWSLGDVAAPAPPLSARFAWDMHHERQPVAPDDFRGRAVLEWSLGVGPDRAAYATVLARELGPPATVGERERYGPFFLSATALEWFAETPDWAHPSADPALRGQALAAFAERVGAGDADGALAGLPDGAGLVPDGSGGVRCEPAAPARELANALGLVDPVAVSVGVHMDSWRLDGPDGLELWLDGWPTGESVGPPGPIGRRRLGGEDRIRAIGVRR